MLLKYHAFLLYMRHILIFTYDKVFTIIEKPKITESHSTLKSTCSHH